MLCLSMEPSGLLMENEANPLGCILGIFFSFSPFSALGRACHITLQFSRVSVAAKAEKPAEVTLLSSKALAVAKY